MVNWCNGRWHVIERVSKELLKDREVILSAVSNNGLAIQFVNKLLL